MSRLHNSVNYLILVKLPCKEEESVVHSYQHTGGIPVVAAASFKAFEAICIDSMITIIITTSLQASIVQILMMS